MSNLLKTGKGRPQKDVELHAPASTVLGNDGTADGRARAIPISELTSLSGVAVKLYILSSDDDHYYQVDVDTTGDATIALTDVGDTAPTDGLIVTGG